MADDVVKHLPIALPLTVLCSAVLETAETERFKVRVSSLEFSHGQPSTAKTILDTHPPDMSYLAPSPSSIQYYRKIGKV